MLMYELSKKLVLCFPWKKWILQK